MLSFPMRGCNVMALGCWLVLGWAGRSDAVIFAETGDPSFHSSTPGDNSGWQYEGKFSYFLGVPIAPYFFITAQHIGGSVGDVFTFHGDSYVTIAIHDIGTTDLRVWEVAHTKPFPTYAPLSSGAADVGATATVLGRGTQRGAAVVVDGETKGWLWGTGDGVERWGRNVVVDAVNAGSLGEFLYCDFNNPGIAGECHLSVGDSGGGMFVLEDGLWRLAGINYAVDGPFRTTATGSDFNAALYDMGGLYVQNPGWVLIDNTPTDIPSSFYCSRVAASLGLITAIAPEAASLGAESYAAWQTLYFTPAQIAAPAQSGPAADFDGDGISNLLEFALNLDPTFAETAVMVADTGLRGLPMVRLEDLSGGLRLTIEYVRRTTASGSGLTYIPEFSGDLQTWTTGGDESVSPINPRWERVKVADTLTTGDAARRFARLRVVLAP